MHFTPTESLHRGGRVGKRRGGGGSLVVIEGVGGPHGVKERGGGSPAYLIFVIFLQKQNFWRIKFTPKKRVNYDKIHRKLPIFALLRHNTQ